MTVTGGIAWLSKSITQNTLVAITDESYIREIYPHLCSAAFVLECSKGCGQIVESFSEALLVATAYRGELLGLKAIHLILLSVNKIYSNLAGSIEIVLDCLGALKQVTYLPPHRIPSQCRHSNILKRILIKCRGLSFTTYYSHMKAHQDDTVSFEKLRSKLQLKCICDHKAKKRIAADGMDGAMSGRMFPLEQIGLFIRKKNDILDWRVDRILVTPPAHSIVLS